MNIKSITVQDYRSIGNNPPLKLELGDLTVLTGINDSGKTSFLVSSYLSTLTYNRSSTKSEYFTRLASLEGSTHYYDSRDEEGEPKVIWEISLTNEQSKIMIENYTQKQVYLKKLETWGIDIKSETFEEFFENISLFLELPLSPPIGFNAREAVNFQRFHTACLDVLKLNRSEEINAFIASLFSNIRDMISEFLGSLESLYIPSSTRDRLLNNILDEFSPSQEEVTSELVEFYKTINTEEKRRNGDYRKFIELSKLMFPDLEKFEISSPADKHINEDLFITWIKNKQQQYQPLSRSGAGITNILYIISKIINNLSNSSIIFIDEPENGLHPKLQLKFISLLKTLSREHNVKVIICTHSPFIMQKLKGKDTLHLIEHNGTQTTGRTIEFEKKEEAFHALGAYLPLSLTANGIIFVEGQTEVTVLSILLNKINLDIEKEGILIIPLGGENLFTIKPRDIKKIHEKCIVLIDSDLTKSERNGGNIRKSKKSYEEACSDSDVDCILLREYRTIENMYPKEELAKVLNINVKELLHDEYSDIPQFPLGNKVGIGEKVALEMSEEQALAFPYVSKILKWWQG
jgi:predicted ATP-dependent endonuclease of OLD family